MSRVGFSRTTVATNLQIWWICVGQDRDQVHHPGRPPQHAAQSRNLVLRERDEGSLSEGGDPALLGHVADDAESKDVEHLQSGLPHAPVHEAGEGVQVLPHEHGLQGEFRGGHRLGEAQTRRRERQHGAPASPEGLHLARPRRHPRPHLRA